MCWPVSVKGGSKRCNISPELVLDCVYHVAQLFMNLYEFKINVLPKAT